MFDTCDKRDCCATQQVIFYFTAGTLGFCDHHAREVLPQVLRQRTGMPPVRRALVHA